MIMIKQLGFKDLMRMPLMMPRPSAGKIVFIMAGIAVIAAMPVPVFCFVLDKLAWVRGKTMTV